MRRRALRHRILWGIVAVLLVAASVATILYFAIGKKGEGTLPTAKVVRASLSSSLSSAGEIQDVATSVKLPLAAVTAESPEKLSEIEANDYTVNLITLIRGENSTPLLYRVMEVNDDYLRKSVTVSTAEESVDIVTLAPVTLDTGKLADYYAFDLAAGRTEAETLGEYMLELIVREGGSGVDHTVLPEDVWRADETAAVTVTTERISGMLKEEMSYLEEIEYKISGLVAGEGDILLLDDNLFTVSYSEHFVSLVLSEYDVAGIDARMRKGERVYAAVSVNALGGRELVAEIVRIGSGTSSSGVTYFSLMARLVFSEIIEAADGTEKGSYLYYDEFLTDETVGYLGVDLRENVREEEILGKYSVTVTAQKTVVKDALIVPTKCIYYNDEKKPYVVKLDSEGKEKRVDIKITLSTGTDAAVIPLEEGALSEGDTLRYTAEASLIGSLF